MKDTVFFLFIFLVLHLNSLRMSLHFWQPIRLHVPLEKALLAYHSAVIHEMEIENVITGAWKFHQAKQYNAFLR